MNQLKEALLSFGIIGLVATGAHAIEIQWATGCTSFQSPSIISVSYNSNSRQITLYRSWLSSEKHRVDVFRAERLNPLFMATPVLFFKNGTEIANLVRQNRKGMTNGTEAKTEKTVYT